MSSVEVRWFVSGPLGSGYRDAFEALGATGPSGWREDTYLVLPEHADVGLKMRREAGTASRAEFKGRVSVTDPIDVGGLEPVPLEQWMKWSIPVTSLPPELAARLRDDEGSLVTVAKRRRLRLVELAPGGPPRAIADPTKRVERGLTIELTDVEVAGETAWTLGFEAFPHDVPAAEVVAPLVRTTLASLGPLPSNAVCCGYPAWLARHR